MSDAQKKQIADKNEIMQFLTDVMRNSQLGEKDRLGAAFKLGRYLGLEGSQPLEMPSVVIYDGTDKDQLS
ncbi:MAG: hypothetical protein IK990_19560 [Ruminiclostridium sp.]|nr:hypothetical protein [Ruminiclostridium sp.]